MTVAQFSGDVAGTTIGLIATSKHQPDFWGQHQPRMDWITDPSNLTPTDQTSLKNYMGDQLGFGSSRFNRGTPQFTGHTALFIRINGAANWARGWVPQPSIGNYLTALVMGGEVPGIWRDDLFMIGDPTCVSVEFDSNQIEAAALQNYFTNNGGNYTHYSFAVGAAGHCNCVWAAVEILRGFAAANGRLALAQRLQKVQDPKQGHMMQMILGGELLVD